MMLLAKYKNDSVNHASEHFTKTIRKQKRRPRLERNLHCVQITIIFLAIIAKIAEFQNMQYKQNVASIINQRKLQPIHIYLYIKYYKEHRIKHPQSEKVIILLLLILSNDIHPLPGPIPQIPKQCSLCNEVTNEEDSFECETCKEQVHVRCSDVDQVSFQQNLSFQWVCPNVNCNPNYREGNHINNLPTSNRYNVLERNTEAQVQGNNSSKPTPINNQRTNTDIKDTRTLFSQLTSISSTDYIGIDKCRSCFREVKDNQPAVECDACESWIHVRCSDMNMKTYNENKMKSRFKWNCNVCRKEEVLIDERIDDYVLEKSKQPDKMEVTKISNKEMLIVHLNARSIMNKIAEFFLFIIQVKPDILCVTETWMDDSVPKQANIPDGYKVMRCDRSEIFMQKYGKTKGGGVAIYYKKELKLERKELIKDENEEIMWVQVKAKQSFLLGAVYRPEYTDILVEEDGESRFEKHIQKAIEISDKVIITGDFNADLTKHLEPKEAIIISNVCKSYGLSQFVKKPTRIDKENRKATIIDHIWADKTKNIVKRCGTLMGISDHFATYAVVNNQVQKKPDETITCRSYKNYDQSNFTNELNEKLEESRLNEHIQRSNQNDAMNEFVKVFQDVAEIHAPTKTIKTKKEKMEVPWFTDELTEKIKLKNEILRDWYIYGLKEDKKAVKKLKNEINHLKYKLKRKYYTEQFRKHEGDMKKTWKLLKEATGNTNIHETIEPENMNKERANKFNHFFATVGSEIQKKLKVMKHRTNFNGLVGFKFQPETEQTVEKLIDRIRHDVAVGPDNISARLIKDSKSEITPWLTKIINLGYQNKSFPDCMKIANIKPLHKKNCTEETSNYRPISILPTLSKVLERAATDQIVGYLERNKLISRNQHAYRKGHSTQTCLVELTNLLYEYMDKGKYSGVASLDLSKAYDSIKHSLLLHKLAKLGFGEESLMWVNSYLSNRKQRTKFKNITSDEEIITSGIPQGSIIGPILFVCFTNDLAEVFGDECHIISYADDTQLVVQANNINELKQKIERMISLAQNWYENNSMKNNIGKSEILIMAKGNKEETVSIQVTDERKPVKLKSKNNLKILGVYIDSKLNWTKQTNYVKKNSINIIRNLHRIKHILPTKEKIRLYNSMVTPHFGYADVVWNGCGIVNARKLQSAQNFAVRTIVNKRKRDSATPILKELRFLNLQQKRQVHEAVFIHKSLLNQQSENINERYKNQQPFSNTRFAAAGKLILPKHRTSKFQNSPFYRTIKTWNNIPAQIPIEKPNIFKNHYQKFLVNSIHPKP